MVANPHIENGTQQSKMTWGGYDLQKYAEPGSDFKFHDCIGGKDATFWLFKLRNITIDSKINPEEAKNYTFGNSPNSSAMIIDSGTSFVQFPKHERDKLHKYLENVQNLSCKAYSDILLCNCTEEANFLERFPDLIFNMGGNHTSAEYVFPRENYLKFHPKKGKCSVRIMSGGSWILGLNFFSNYYTVFDMENQRVGLALSRNALPRLKSSNRNQTELVEVFDTEIWLKLPKLKLDIQSKHLSILPGIIGLLGTVAAFKWFLGQKREKSEDHYNKI